MGSIAITRMYEATARDVAAASLAWDRPADADASLVVAVPRDDAIVLGAFQRRGDVVSSGAVLRRGSGGPAATVGPGTVWVQLGLARSDALVPCTADKILNRYVRPLLRASTRSASVQASYFGRDWISAAGRPVALVAFAHDASTGRAMFEAIVAVRAPFWSAPRGSFLGKPPATLEELTGRALDPRLVSEAIVDAYAAIASEAPARGAPPGHAEVPPYADVEDDPPWAAVREEAIGAVAAGPDRAGRLRVGGELMASRDAVSRLEDRVAELPTDADLDELGGAVDDALSTRGAVIFGVRSLRSIRDVVAAARA